MTCDQLQELLDEVWYAWISRMNPNLTNRLFSQKQCRSYQDLDRDWSYPRQFEKFLKKYNLYVASGYRDNYRYLYSTCDQHITMFMLMRPWEDEGKD